MGRTSDAKERLLESATHLIQTKGYSAVGIAEVCQDAGVNKGSFYHFFRSKQRLGIEVIDQHWAVGRQAWRDVLEDTRRSPLSRLKRLLQQSYEGHCESQAACGAMVGCILGNLALELSTQDEEVRAHLEGVFDEQAQAFEKVLREAVKAGELPKNTNAARSARSLLAYLEGSVVLAKVKNDPSVLRELFQGAMRLVGAN